MRKNKLKQMFKEGKPIINGWLQIPSAFSAEVMAHQGWDSCTCLLYTSPSPRDVGISRMPSSA